MRKNHFFIGISLLALVLISWNLQRKKNDVSPVSTVTKVVAPTVEVVVEPEKVIPPQENKTDRKNLEIRNIAQAFVKSVHARKEITSSFSLKKISGSDFEVVTNYIGVVGEVKQGIGFLAGYQLQDASDGDQLNLLLNKQTGKFGVWTREIIVTGNDEAIDQLSQKLNLERVSQGSQRVIFRVPDQVRIEDIVSEPGLTIEPDIIYSRASAI